MKNNYLKAAILIIIGVFLFFGFASKNPQTIWHLTNATGHLPDLKFSLVDDANKQVTEKSYQGKIVLLYFGFTGCSTECPLTMARLEDILKQMSSATDGIKILFVTVDPFNDNPKALHNFIAKYDAAHMVGLGGGNSQIEALAKTYRASYRSNNQGDIPHSNLIYIFDKKGHARLIAMPNDSDQNIINDLSNLLAEND